MAVGTSSTVSAPAFHADDPEQISDYRKLSVLAIISLVFGVAAPLALAAPLLIAIPLFGIAVSILALRQIAVSGGLLAGRWAATAGLALCIASAFAPVSRDYVFRFIRTSEAKDVARNWIEILTSGELERAFQMTVDGARPQPAPEPGMPPPKTTPYQTFLDQPAVKALKGAGANAEIRFDGTRGYQPISYRNVTVRQQFTISPASAASPDSESKPIVVIVGLQRATLPGESMSKWLVSRCDDAKTADQSVLGR